MRVAAEPNELRRFADELDRSAVRLQRLGVEAASAAASARSPQAAQAVAVATRFAATTAGRHAETSAVTTGVRIRAALFEAADTWGWLPPSVAAGASTLASTAMWLKGTGKGLYRMWKKAPHTTNPSAWRKFFRELGSGRGSRSRYWGFWSAKKSLMTYGRSRWQRLTHAGSEATKFVARGHRAVDSLSKNTSLRRRVTPIVKFGGGIVGKVLRPLNIVRTYQDSKAKSTVGKATSTGLQILFTKNPISWAVDTLSGGQIAKTTEAVVDGAEHAMDGDLDSFEREAHSGEHGAFVKHFSQAVTGATDFVSQPFFAVQWGADTIGDPQQMHYWQEANRNGSNGVVMETMQHSADWTVSTAGHVSHSVSEGWRTATRGISDFFSH